MGILELLATGGLGLLIVFAVLAVLIVAIGVMTMFFGKKNKGEKSADERNIVPLAPVEPARAVTDAPKAVGSCGGVVLNGVEEKTAAMLMAIVADELNTPLNELRFTSVREIYE